MRSRFLIANKPTNLSSYCVGKILSENVYNSQKVKLLNKGTKLTLRDIDLLSRHNVSKVYLL